MKINLGERVKKDLCDIAPKWKQRIIDPKDNLKNIINDDGKVVLQISNPRWCIVGEAYGFDNGYARLSYSFNDKVKRCNKCEFYSMVMYDSITGKIKEKFPSDNHFDIAYFKPFIAKKPFEKYIVEFIKHFKQQHYKQLRQVKSVENK